MKENEELLTDELIQKRMDKLEHKFKLRRYKMTKILLSFVGSWIVLCLLFNFPKKLALWLSLPELARFPVNALVIIVSIILWWLFWYSVLSLINIITTIPETKEWLKLEKLQNKRSEKKKEEKKQRRDK